MKKYISLFLLLIIAICCVTAHAESKDLPITVKFGENAEIFNKNGVNAYFTGEVDDSGTMWLSLKAVIDNKTNTSIKVAYEGVCNGWSVKHSIMGGSDTSIYKNSKGKCYLWLNYDDLELQRYGDIKELMLDFIVMNASTSEEMFRVNNVHFEFPDQGLPELVYYEECPVLPTPEKCTDFKQTGHSKSSSNGKVTKIKYKYSLRSNSRATLDDSLNAYLDVLKIEGFSTSKSGNSTTISYDKKKVATVKIADSVLEIDIVPGNDKLKKK